MTTTQEHERALDQWKDLIAIILPGANCSLISEKYLFDNARGFDTAHGKLMAWLADPDKEGGIGEPLDPALFGQEQRGKFAQVAKPNHRLLPCYLVYVPDLIVI